MFNVLTSRIAQRKCRKLLGIKEAGLRKDYEQVVVIEYTKEKTKVARDTARLWRSFAGFSTSVELFFLVGKESDVLHFVHHSGFLLVGTVAVTKIIDTTKKLRRGE